MVDESLRKRALTLVFSMFQDRTDPYHADVWGEAAAKALDIGRDVPRDGGSYRCPPRWLRVLFEQIADRHGVLEAAGAAGINSADLTPRLRRSLDAAAAARADVSRKAQP